MLREHLSPSVSRAPYLLSRLPTTYIGARPKKEKDEREEEKSLELHCMNYIKLCMSSGRPNKA